MPSNVLVSGAGTSSVDGVYTYRGVFNGKPFYNLLNQPTDIENYSIWWTGIAWYLVLTNTDEGYLATQNTTFPWLDTVWEVSTAGISVEPAPMVTEIPEPSSQNTFGLPADVVALITSRFGTVANFLRLRNLGYI